MCHYAEVPYFVFYCAKFYSAECCQAGGIILNFMQSVFMQSVIIIRYFIVLSVIILGVILLSAIVHFNMLSLIFLGAPIAILSVIILSVMAARMSIHVKVKYECQNS